jgi:penicillin-insensitive murein endopeptidase
MCVVLSGCGSLASISDGTSVSYGWTNRGRILGAVELPVRGDGYLIPPTWSSRGLNWGTEELVGLLVRAGRRLAAEGVGATLYIADMSPRAGGPSAWHKSHQAGRDADVLFFSVDDGGRPMGPPAAMLPFDTARNWQLVRALVDDATVDVQFLFISSALRQKLLDHAVEASEPADLIERASAVLVQPGDAPPHDDHLHVRIYCPVSDRSMGCRESGPIRWFKKGYKYAADRVPLLTVMAQAGCFATFCQFLAPGFVATL